MTQWDDIYEVTYDEFLAFVDGDTSVVTDVMIEGDERGRVNAYVTHKECASETLHERVYEMEPHIEDLVDLVRDVYDS